MMFRSTCIAAVTLVLAVADARASAIFTVEFGSDPGNTTTWAPSNVGEVANPDGTFSYTGNTPFGGGNYDALWNVTTNADPYVDGVFAITNNTASVQTFVLTFSASVTPALATAVGGASVIGTLTVDGDGGTLGHVPDGPDLDLDPEPMFEALVDGASFLGLLAYDSSVTAAFGSASTGSDAFGLPGLTTPIPGGVASSIGIRLSFTLTPGDSASFTSRFEVIPEPTTALLVGAGLLGFALSRRR